MSLIETMNVISLIICLAMLAVGKKLEVNHEEECT